MSEPLVGQKFHDHLDVCEQCAHHPFQLCETGARLLREAVVNGLPSPFVQRRTKN